MKWISPLSPNNNLVLYHNSVTNLEMPRCSLPAEVWWVELGPVAVGQLFLSGVHQVEVDFVDILYIIYTGSLVTTHVSSCLLELLENPLSYNLSIVYGQNVGQQYL